MALHQSPRARITSPPQSLRRTWLQDQLWTMLPPPLSWRRRLCAALARRRPPRSRIASSLLRLCSPRAGCDCGRACGLSSGRCCHGRRLIALLPSSSGVLSIAACMRRYTLPLSSFDVLSIATSTHRYSSTLLEHSVAAGSLGASALGAAASTATIVVLLLRSLGVPSIAMCTLATALQSSRMAWLQACLRHEL